MMTPTQYFVDCSDLVLEIIERLTIPPWLIRKRQAEDPLSATNGAEADLVIYRNLVLSGTSLYIKDSHGYIYLGKTREILRLRPNGSLEAISIGRKIKSPEHEICITYGRLDYKWEIEVSRLSPHT